MIFQGSIHKWFKLFLCLVFVFCTLACGRVDVKEQKVDMTSVLITHFQILDNDNPILKNTFWSIDQKRGLIYNAKELPVNFKMDSVKVDVTRSPNADISFYVGDALIRVGENDSLSLKNWKNGIKIQVKDTKSSKQKDYHLNINQYSYDPQSYIWTKLKGKTIPSYETSKGFWTKVVGDNVYLILQEQSGDLVFYKTSKKDLDFSHRIVLPTEAGEIKNITASEKAIFLLNKNGDLFSYLIEENKLEKMVVKESDILLMDILGFCGQEKKSFLSLLVKQNDRFYFARYMNNNIEIGENVSSDFPRKNLETILLEKANSKFLILTGEKASIWTTTTGLDWLILPKKEKKELPSTIGKKIFINNTTEDILYCLIPANDVQEKSEMAIYFSKDNGVSWDLGITSLCLPQDKEFLSRGKGLQGFFLEKHSIILFGGKTRLGNFPRDIWEGIPQLYKENN